MVIVGAGEVLWDVFGEREHFGGAPANVAVHAAALGAEAWLVSAVGLDARGDAALERLRAAGVDWRAVSRLGDHPTGVVQVSVDARGLPSYDIAAGSAWDYVPWTALVERAAQRAAGGPRTLCAVGDRSAGQRGARGRDRFAGAGDGERGCDASERGEQDGGTTRLHGIPFRAS